MISCLESLEIVPLTTSPFLNETSGFDDIFAMSSAMEEAPEGLDEFEAIECRAFHN